MEDAKLSSTVCFEIEQRFNCLICWAPKLRMIYGSCQHRLCEDCVYDEDGERRVGLERCPTCLRQHAFPATRPDIPEDNIEIQVQIGVRKCPNRSCRQQMWCWELHDHLLACPYVSKMAHKIKRSESLDDPGHEMENTKLNMILRKRPRLVGPTFDAVQRQRRGQHKKHNLRPRKRKTTR